MMINTYSKIVSIIDLLSRVKPIIATAILISVICFSITPIKAQTAGDEITSLTWNSLSTELAIAGRFSGDYGIQIRDNSGQVLISLPTRNRPLSVSWSNDDQYIASVFRQDNQHMIQIWERSGFPFNSILEQGAKTNYSVQWFPGSNTSMLATEASGLLNLWNFETGNREDVIAHQGSMNISIFDWIWNDMVQKYLLLAIIVSSVLGI